MFLSRTVLTDVYFIGLFASYCNADINLLGCLEVEELVSDCILSVIYSVSLISSVTV